MSDSANRILKSEELLFRTTAPLWGFKAPPSGKLVGFEIAGEANDHLARFRKLRLVLDAP